MNHIRRHNKRLFSWINTNDYNLELTPFVNFTLTSDRQQITRCRKIDTNLDSNFTNNNKYYYGWTINETNRHLTGIGSIEHCTKTGYYIAQNIYSGNKINPESLFPSIKPCPNWSSKSSQTTKRLKRKNLRRQKSELTDLMNRNFTIFRSFLRILSEV